MATENETPEELTTEIDAAIEEMNAAPEETPAEEAPTDDGPADDAPSDDAPADDAHADDQPADDEAPSADAPADESPTVDDAPTGPSQFMKARAIRAGLEFEDLEAFKDDSSLERVVSLLESKKDDGSDVVPGTDEEADDDPLKYLDLPEDTEVAPEIAELFGKTKEVIKGLMGQVKELSVGFSDSSEQAAIKATTSEFDSRISSLGADYEDALGKGTIDDIKKDSPEFARRAELFDSFATLKAGYELKGKKVSDDDIFKKAVAMTVSGKVNALKKRASDRESQILFRGDNNKNETNKSDTDPAASVAAEIDAEFFSKE